MHALPASTRDRRCRGRTRPQGSLDGDEGAEGLGTVQAGPSGTITALWFSGDEPVLTYRSIQVVLAVGNALNGSTFRGGAGGFEMEALLKVCSVSYQATASRQPDDRHAVIAQGDQDGQANTGLPDASSLYRQAPYKDASISCALHRRVAPSPFSSSEFVFPVTAFGSPTN